MAFYLHSKLQKKNCMKEKIKRKKKIVDSAQTMQDIWLMVTDISRNKSESTVRWSVKSISHTLVKRFCIAQIWSRSTSLAKLTITW